MSRKLERILWLLVLVAMLVACDDDKSMKPAEKWNSAPELHCKSSTIINGGSITIDCYHVTAGGGQ